MDIDFCISFTEFTWIYRMNEMQKSPSQNCRSNLVDNSRHRFQNIYEEGAWIGLLIKIQDDGPPSAFTLKLKSQNSHGRRPSCQQITKF